MKIPVTRKHIEAGDRKNTESCAIALATRELVLEDVTVNVTGSSIIFSKIRTMRGGYSYISSNLAAVLPEEAVEFIVDFDKGLPVAPFEFEINDGFLEPYIKPQAEPIVTPAPEPELELVGV